MKQLLITLSMISMFSMTFQTCEDPNDGDNYETVQIGDQTWMAENLKVTEYRNGDAITHASDNNAWTSATSGAYCTAPETFGSLLSSKSILTIQYNSAKALC